jgi:Flp pilus assembly protein TadD
VLKQSLSISKHQALTNLTIAKLLHETGNVTEAIKFYEVTVQLSETDASACNLLASAYK